jgi:hypothetical protein
MTPTLLWNTTAGDPVLSHRGGEAFSRALGVRVGVGQRPVVRVDPEHRVGAAGRLGHVRGVAQVADGQLDPVAHLGVEAGGVAQQQAGTRAGLTQQPHHMRSHVARGGRDGDRHAG